MGLKTLSNPHEHLSMYEWLNSDVAEFYMEKASISILHFIVFIVESTKTISGASLLSNISACLCARASRAFYQKYFFYSTKLCRRITTTRGFFQLDKSR